MKPSDARIGSGLELNQYSMKLLSYLTRQILITEIIISHLCQPMYVYGQYSVMKASLA